MYTDVYIQMYTYGRIPPGVYIPMYAYKCRHTNVSPRSPEVCNSGLQEPSFAPGPKNSKPSIEIIVLKLFLTGCANQIFFSSATGSAGIRFFGRFPRQMYTYRCIHTNVYIQMHTHRRIQRYTYRCLFWFHF